MTLRERIIVECYTGFCMCTGEERWEVYKYAEEKMGHPVWTHFWANEKFCRELREACKDDFVALCKGE